MAYGSPYADAQDIYQQQSGALGTVGSIALDALKWTTWRNPFFTARIGAAGWDPKLSKIGGFLNRFLAPEAHKMYSHMNELGKANYSDLRKGVRAGQSRGRVMWARQLSESRMPGGKHPKDWIGRRELIKSNQRAMGRAAQSRARGRVRSAARMYGVNEEKFAAAYASRSKKPKGIINGILRLTGQRRHSAMEKLVGDTVERRIKSGGGTLNTMLSGATRGARFNAGLRIAGRGLTAASPVLLAFDAAQMAFSGFAAVSEWGAKQAMRPTHMPGTGIVQHPGAANLRRKMIMEMHSSHFGPRRLMGNEASFLHS